MPDIEAMARAMFERLHGLAGRPRTWNTHPDEDSGAEMGRKTFREMADAAASVPDVVDEPVAVEVVAPVLTDSQLAALATALPANDTTAPSDPA